MWIFLRGEIVLYTKEDDLTNVKISSGDFINELGEKIGSENIEINYLKYISAHAGRGFNWGNIPGDNVPREMVPDVIYSSEAIDISKGLIKPAWVEINVPKDAKPGLYNGKIMIIADGIEEIELDYSFEVLNINQPLANENEFHLELWQYPYTFARYYNVEAFSDKFFEMIKPQMQVYKEAGSQEILSLFIQEIKLKKFQLQEAVQDLKG